ncbi:hypothetical protein CFBP2533_16070 [Xanthomonas hortorum pv. pelargonii]|uniref:Uncharacterized protein n=1 Tax=Xanthomonas hortorum pv. pelargonii TaxID=453602 RepID=A0A6V7CSJ8_9XANT|nr:hypothetical protein CFBP2533_16070 [Xanthomonas hortorum pv. pelargonii]CAD0321129.1 hypothetical protein CFBP2533_16070 [Xanthomonas hortorum pv. pelargonii]
MPKARALPARQAPWALPRCSAPDRYARRYLAQAARPERQRGPSARPVREQVWHPAQQPAPLLACRSAQQLAWPQPVKPGWRQKVRSEMRLPVLPGCSARYARCRAWLACCGERSWPLATQLGKPEILPSGPWLALTRPSASPHPGQHPVRCVVAARTTQMTSRRQPESCRIRHLCQPYVSADFSLTTGP